jgi:hypothetical protein
MAEALVTVHTRKRRLFRGWWWPVVSKLVFDQMAAPVPKIIDGFGVCSVKGKMVNEHEALYGTRIGRGDRSARVKPFQMPCFPPSFKWPGIETSHPCGSRRPYKYEDKQAAFRWVNKYLCRTKKKCIAAFVGEAPSKGASCTIE